MGRDLLTNPGMKGRSTAPARVFCTDIARMAWPWDDDPTVTTGEFLHGDRWTTPSEEGLPGLDGTVPPRKPLKYEVMLPQIVEMTEAGSGVDLISRALRRDGGRGRASTGATRWHGCGRGGIRTHEPLSRLPVFKTGAFNRSATRPAGSIPS